MQLSKKSNMYSSEAILANVKLAFVLLLESSHNKIIHQSLRAFVYRSRVLRYFIENLSLEKNSKELCLKKTVH